MITDAMIEAAHIAYERYGQSGDGRNARLSDGCMRAVLAAALNPASEPQWQPIETAPKDGTCIVGYSISLSRICSRTVIRWRQGWSSWSSVPGDYTCYPTHWRPLPEPPEATNYIQEGTKS